MDELDELIARWTSQFAADELLERLHTNGVPAGRIFRAKDMFSDPHFAAREAIIHLVHPQIGDLAMHNVFPRLTETPGKVRRVGPTLGEHNEDIYKGLLEMDDASVASLHSAGII